MTGWSGFGRLGCLPEKRKVGGSTPPLTQGLGIVA